MRYCAYQERCRQEVTRKMQALDLMEEDQAEMLLYLEEEGYLDERRFAVAFAGGKFRVKRWGKIKISKALWQKGVPKNLIERAFRSEISDEDYLNTLGYLVEREREKWKHLSRFEQKKKIYRYLSQKGYEAHWIWEVLGDQGDE